MAKLNEKKPEMTAPEQTVAPEQTTSGEQGLEQMKAELVRMLEEVKAETAKLEAAKEEAAKVVEDAKGSVAPRTEADEAKKAYEAYMNEYVPVTLFKDSGKYKDDKFVSVNGENCVIKRGERAMIKRKFAEVLDASDFQDYQTARLIEDESKENKFAGNV